MVRPGQGGPLFQTGRGAPSQRTRGPHPFAGNSLGGRTPGPRNLGPAFSPALHARFPSRGSREMMRLSWPQSEAERSVSTAILGRRGSRARPVEGNPPSSTQVVHQGPERRWRFPRRVIGSTGWRAGASNRHVVTAARCGKPQQGRRPGAGPDQPAFGPSGNCRNFAGPGLATHEVGRNRERIIASHRPSRPAGLSTAAESGGGGLRRAPWV